MRKSRLIFVAIGAPGTVVISAYLVLPPPRLLTDIAHYNPTINPDNFGILVNNKYFTLRPGTTFTYKSEAVWGTERREVAVSHETKKIMGITTIIVRDRIWWNDQLIDDTKDFYAQDKQGNVWYFGETVDNYQEGRIRDHSGSWEAGVDGAKPGIIMPKDPRAGDSYQHEHRKGYAEDIMTIVGLGKKVTVSLGTFENCLKVRDWSPLAWTSTKYFCPDVGFAVVEEPALLGVQRTELVSVSSQQDLMDAPLEKSLNH